MVWDLNQELNPAIALNLYFILQRSQNEADYEIDKLKIVLQALEDVLMDHGGPDEFRIGPRTTDRPF